MILIAESISHLENGNANLNTKIMKTKCMSCGGSMKMKAGGSKSDLAKKYGDPTKITRGDIITAAKQNAGTAKMGGSYKKGGSVKKKK